MILLFIATLLFSLGASEPLALNRVRMTKNPAKHCSVRFHGQTPELVLIHAILRFSSPINQYHNALLIEKGSLSKYRKILLESESKIAVSSRTVKKTLLYLTVVDNTTTDANDDGVSDKLYEIIHSAAMFGIGLSSTISYDGVLLLDEYSSIWSEYNIMVFSKSLLTLSYSMRGALSVENTEFSGVTRIACDPTYDSDQCLVLSASTGLTVNQHLYPHYRLLIDLDSTANLLPIDLYLQWQAGGTNSLSIRLPGDDDNYLFLNGEFDYDMHQSNIILLGVDMIHHFPRVEYSVTKKAFQLYYADSVHNHYETQRSVKIFFVFLTLLLLICLFRWGTSYNYQILSYIIHFPTYARRVHFFAYKQIIFEVLAVIVAYIAIIVSFVVSEPVRTWTLFQQRKVLFTCTLLHNSVIALYLIFSHRESLRALYYYYFPLKQRGRCVVRNAQALPYAEVFADIVDRRLAHQLHCAVVRFYHDPVIKLYTPLSITRNLTFITLILFGLKLVFNFYTEANNIYLLLIVGLSFGHIYYQSKYIAISVLYLALFYPCRVTPLQRAANIKLVLFIAVNLLSLLLGIYSSYDCVFLAYFNTINSTHSVATIHAYILGIISTLILLAIVMVNIAFDKYADPIIEHALDTYILPIKRCRRIQKTSL